MKLRWAFLGQLLLIAFLGGVLRGVISFPDNRFFDVLAMGALYLLPGVVIWAALGAKLPTHKLVIVMLLEVVLTGVMLLALLPGAM